jgi:hypothetical protein
MSQRRVSSPPRFDRSWSGCTTTPGLLPATRSPSWCSDSWGPSAHSGRWCPASWPCSSHVNLQTAIDAWSREAGREVVVHGLMLPPHHGDVTLQQVVTGDGHSPLRLSSPAFVDLPSGPGTTLACLDHAVLLVTDERGRFVARITAPREHMPTLEVEVAGLEVDEAQAVHAPVPGRTDDGLHPADADRPRADRHRIGRRARTGSSAGGDRARGRRPRRGGTQPGPGFDAGAL